MRLPEIPYLAFAEYLKEPPPSANYDLAELDVFSMIVDETRQFSGEFGGPEHCHRVMESRYDDGLVHSIVPIGLFPNILDFHPRKALLKYTI